MSKVRTWTISHGRNGFELHVVEKNRLGVVLTWLLDHLCLHSKNHRVKLFCLIDPWAWTWRIGTEEHKLGGGLWSFGNWLHNRAWNLEKEHVNFKVTLTNDQVKAGFQDSWDWAAEMFDESYLDECEELRHDR